MCRFGYLPSPVTCTFSSTHYIIQVGGHCNFHSSHATHYIQLITGIAQNTTTFYWYNRGADPFLSWLLTAANDPSPPSVTSISWGVVEQSVHPDLLKKFSEEAMKYTLRGVSIVVAAGDSGVSGSMCWCHKPTEFGGQG